MQFKLKRAEFIRFFKNLFFNFDFSFPLRYIAEIIP